MQLYFAPASYAPGSYGTSVLDSVPGMTLGCSQLRPESTGHVKALSSDPAAKPEIQPNYPWPVAWNREGADFDG